MPTTSTSRSANVLVATLIVLAGVGGMLALTSDRLVGTRELQSINLARQQASYAAEAIASLVETKLVESSGDLNNLTKDVVEGDESNPSVAQRWLQQGLYHQGEMTTKGMWIGNSLVYWRIEPVKIYSETIADTNKDGLITNEDTLGESFTDNYRANPNEVVKPTVAWSGTSMHETNPGYYHFRIITQSYYINQKEWSKAGLTLDSADPWTKPQHTIASAQTQRMVQLKLINLFRYVLFYGANGPTGDIELNPGAELNIRGAVHTNGALYLGGQGKNYINNSDGDYTNSASSFAGIHIGAKDKIATITGVDGIFRTRKVGNFWYQASRGGLPSVQEPYNIPIKHALNGNDPGSTIVTLNGKAFTYENDSRSALTGHSDYVRDRRNRNASTVNTLANIPQLSGYPFEHQQVVGQGQLIFRDAAGNYTIRPKDFPGAQQLYYQNPAGGDFTVTTVNTTFPVYATDLPLFSYRRGSSIVQDIFTNQPTTASVVNPAALVMHGDPDSALRTMDQTFLAHPAAQIRNDPTMGMEARGYYLGMSLFGQQGSNRTGLTIRERGAQNIAWRMLDPLGAVITGVAALPLRANYPSEATFVQAMSAYMARNYVVYLGFDNTGVTPADITAAFFGLVPDGTGQMVGTYTTLAQLPAQETPFMNRREADSLQRMGYLTAAQATAYRSDVLTLNIARIQELIGKTKYIDLYPPTSRDPALRTNVLFNGLIYAHRTPRLGQTSLGTAIHDPRMPLDYSPLITARLQRTLTGTSGTDAAVYNFTGGLYPIIGSVTRARLNTAANSPDRNGDPLFSLWSVFPSLKQVRVVNGGTIDWGATQTSGRNQGLTVVTPNHCYIQGNYNTTQDSKKKYPPCGIYADGMTMLTNRWVDGVMTLTSTPAGDTTTYNVSLVTNNIPTDYENAWDEGSGGTHNLLRFLENGGRDFNFLGSIVVLNRMRYGRNYLGAALGYYGAPTRKLNFNDDLLTAEGQPPFSPWGIQVTRVLSSVNIVNR